jgi:serine-type D-Ala-D-Ala carboxypeptidase (penicillin-binding protein 5/6)
VTFAPRQSSAAHQIDDLLFEDEARAERIAIQRAVAARRRQQAQFRRRRIGAVLALALFGWVVATVVSGPPATRLAGASANKIRLTALVTSTTVVPGTLGPIDWPATGQGAVAVLGSGLMASSPRQPIVPIASLTKMMTAYIILHDHPLRPGESGPSLTMNASDYAEWVQADSTDESNVGIKMGEVLSEYQLLEALLIPSADNVAVMLADWDAGSVPAFVAKMNATARALGLVSTTYADASGVNPKSRSTASDQAILAATLMSNPVVRSIVRQPSLPFQVNGTIWNFNPALGTDGIIGVKSGYTSQAQACLATAAFRDVGGRSVLVVAVSLSQPWSLTAAATADEALLESASPQLELWHPTFSATALARASLGSSVMNLALASKVPSVVAWPGLQLNASVVPVATSSSASSSATSNQRSEVVADLVLSDSLGVLATLPLVATSSPQATSDTVGESIVAAPPVTSNGASPPADTKAGG